MTSWSATSSRPHTKPAARQAIAKVSGFNANTNTLSPYELWTARHGRSPADPPHIGLQPALLQHERLRDLHAARCVGCTRDLPDLRSPPNDPLIARSQSGVMTIEASGPLSSASGAVVTYNDAAAWDARRRQPWRPALPGMGLGRVEVTLRLAALPHCQRRSTLRAAAARAAASRPGRGLRTAWPAGCCQCARRSAADGPRRPDCPPSPRSLHPFRARCAGGGSAGGRNRPSAARHALSRVTAHPPATLDHPARPVPHAGPAAGRLLEGPSGRHPARRARRR